MLVLILALVNGPQPSPVPDRTASPPAHARPVTASVGEAVGGTWAGEWADAGAGAPIGLEAAFTTGAARTVFAYFTFIEHGVRRTVLRQGVTVADGLHFVWPGGRRLELRLTNADRLEGTMVAMPAEGAPGVAGSMSLSRRPR